MPFSFCWITNSSPSFAASFKSTDHFPSSPTVAFTSFPSLPCFVTTIVAPATPLPVTFVSPALMSFTAGKLDNLFSWGFLSGCFGSTGFCGFGLSFFALTVIIISPFLYGLVWYTVTSSPSFNSSPKFADQLPCLSTVAFLFMVGSCWFFGFIIR